MPGSTPSINAASPSRTRVEQAIAGAASRTEIDFGYLYNQARVESSLDPAARARTSSAAGLYQFTRGTWLATVKQHGAEHGLGWAADAVERRADGSHGVDPALRDAVLGLRFDADASAAMAAEFAVDNRDTLEDALGRSAEPVDLYLAHFLGPAGAVRFLEAHDADPSAHAAPLLPTAAAANRAIFYASDGRARSLGEIRQSFAQRIGTAVAPPAAPALVRRSVSTSESSRPMAMRGFEAMPARLSPDFAASAYARLAELAG